ncbi:MAG TPA: hypothetical protein VH351_14235 [Bryobacteraceae bacterium]|jgi:outer membrane lipoprotein-sorting protein|nr:hypothetical protein [Bryobacteraceae bacterium]
MPREEAASFFVVSGRAAAPFGVLTKLLTTDSSFAAKFAAFLFCFLPRTAAYALLITTAAFSALVHSAQAASPDPVSIWRAMERAAQDQHNRLCSYSVHRVYKLENKHLHPAGEMDADVNYTLGKPKQFRITLLQAKGVARRSLQELLKQESDTDGLRNENSTIAPGNYELSLLGEERCGDADCYKISMKPKKKSKYLIEGTGWVSKRDYMFVRITGTMSKSPSFWLSRPNIEQRFSSIDSFWLPSFNRSTTDILFFGEADLTIEYSGYSVTSCQAGPSSK